MLTARVQALNGLVMCVLTNVEVNFSTPLSGRGFKARNIT